MRSMQAAVAREIPTERLQIDQVEAPALEADDDVILRVEACGICGTDLHILSGESYRPQTPFVLGHEPVGVVVEAGPAANEWLGLRVTMTNYTGEGSCPMCMSAIYWARIDRVYFGTRLSDTSKIGFDDEFQYIDFQLPWEER